MNILAILTEHTCGEACWSAREDICRCSCGGKNHGCLREANGVRPVRSAKIDGKRYTLKAVGTYGEMESIAKPVIAEPYHVEHISTMNGGTMTYRYHWRTSDAGSPVRVKCAGKSQIAAWPELTAYRDRPRYEQPPYLLWELLPPINLK